MKISLSVCPLNIPLKSNFKQSSFNRISSESVWVEVCRGGLSGYGEGCPRIYVTGETLSDSVNWISEKTEEIIKTCVDLEALQFFVQKNESQIDSHPAAWCAVELALLDLFAREKKTSLEGLLGLQEVTSAFFKYTAVLSDDEPEAFFQKLQLFKKIGFEQYKMKISGAKERDKKKFEAIRSELQNVPHTLRVDANNLWGDDLAAATTFFEGLNVKLIGIEEPFNAKYFQAIAALSLSQNTPVILDESVTRKADLQEAFTLSTNVIVNVKVAKLGGVIRSMETIDEARKCGVPIIIGAHVGETSVLTRAGMLLANYTGSSLLGQEGAFGEYLLQRDVVEPVIQIGYKGQIDFSKPYIYENAEGPIAVPQQNWNIGWGLRQREPLVIHGQ